MNDENKPLEMVVAEGRGPEDERLRAKVNAALADPRPSIPAEVVFERLRERQIIDLSS